MEKLSNIAKKFLVCIFFPGISICRYIVTVSWNGDVWGSRDHFTPTENVKVGRRRKSSRHSIETPSNREWQNITYILLFVSQLRIWARRRHNTLTRAVSGLVSQASYRKLSSPAVWGETSTAGLWFTPVTQVVLHNTGGERGEGGGAELHRGD